MKLTMPVDTIETKDYILLMSHEANIGGLLQGVDVGQRIREDLADDDFVVEASIALRRETEILLRQHGTKYKPSLAQRGFRLLAEVLAFPGIMPIAPLQDTTSLKKSFARNDQEFTVKITADTAEDPKNASYIEVKPSAKGGVEYDILLLPQNGPAFFQTDIAPFADDTPDFSRASAGTYNDLVGVVRECLSPRPRLYDIVCLNR